MEWSWLSFIVGVILGGILAAIAATVVIFRGFIDGFNRAFGW